MVGVLFTRWNPSTQRSPLTSPPVITQNFLVNVVEAELGSTLVNAQGAPTPTADSFNRFDTCLTCIFVAELAVNLYAHWSQPDVMNRFDSGLLCSKTCCSA